jgi:hypothetical protein
MQLGVTYETVTAPSWAILPRIARPAPLANFPCVTRPDESVCPLSAAVVTRYGEEEDQLTAFLNQLSVSMSLSVLDVCLPPLITVTAVQGVSRGHYGCCDTQRA